jgi:UDP-glucose 4-epimerase
MRVIVTGGAGFIGSHVVEKFCSEGHDVIVIDNLSTGRKKNISHLSRVRLIESDLADLNGEWRAAIQPDDWVFHLAALADVVPCIQSPDKYFRANVVGTYNLVSTCIEKKVGRFIYAASSSGYGLTEQIPTTESAPILPQYPYALTKRLGEEIVLHWAQVYKLPAISLRLFNVYGPRARSTGSYGAMFGVFLAQKRAGKPFTIVGDGKQTRDFTYVSDVAEAFYAAAKSSLTGEIFNVGSGATVSVNRVAEILGGPSVHIPKRPAEPDCTFADISKIRGALGWQPKVFIEEGIEKMLGHLEDFSDAPVWDAKSIAGETADWFKFLGSK